MQTFELTQKILSLGPSYEVRPGDPGTQADVAVTIRGKLFSATPQLAMVQGTDGPQQGLMKGNFTRTKFECFDQNAQLVGSLAFPLLALKKSFTLKAGDKEYKADGGWLGGEFTCKDDKGETVLVIKKELSLRDKFSIQASDDLPAQLALLAAVAIDQRFFQDE
jgi:uncharacterized protein YxjI